MSHDPTPAEALASIRETGDRVVPTDYPLGYDLVYGLICAVLVAGPGMPQPWATLSLVLALAALALMVRAWKARMGWWVSGYSPRRARWAAVGLAAVFIALIGVSLYGRYAGPDWLFLVSGGVAFVAAIVGSRVWMAVWRKELREVGR